MGSKEKDESAVVADDVEEDEYNYGDGGSNNLDYTVSLVKNEGKKKSSIHRVKSKRYGDDYNLDSENEAENEDMLRDLEELNELEEAALRATASTMNENLKPRKENKVKTKKQKTVKRREKRKKVDGTIKRSEGKSSGVGSNFGTGFDSDLQEDSQDEWESNVGPNRVPRTKRAETNDSKLSRKGGKFDDSDFLSSGLKTPKQAEEEMLEKQGGKELFAKTNATKKREKEQKRKKGPAKRVTIYDIFDSEWDVKDQWKTKKREKEKAKLEENLLPPGMEEQQIEKAKKSKSGLGGFLGLRTTLFGDYSGKTREDRLFSQELAQQVSLKHADSEELAKKGITVTASDSSLATIELDDSAALDDIENGNVIDTSKLREQFKATKTGNPDVKEMLHKQETQQSEGSSSLFDRLSFKNILGFVPTARTSARTKNYHETVRLNAHPPVKESFSENGNQSSSSLKIASSDDVNLEGVSNLDKRNAEYWMEVFAKKKLDKFGNPIEINKEVDFKLKIEKEEERTQNRKRAAGVSLFVLLLGAVFVVILFFLSPGTFGISDGKGGIAGLNVTGSPTQSPTNPPVSGPTESPTQFPTRFPSLSPTAFPTNSPTRFPVVGPAVSGKRCPEIRTDPNVTTPSKASSNNFGDFTINSNDGSVTICADTYAGVDPKDSKRNYWAADTGNKNCPTRGWADCQNVCEQVGARLCTSLELTKGAATGTGCGGDNSRVWSGTPCDGGFFTITFGGSSSVDFEQFCQTDLNAQTVIRCCGDY